MNTYRKTAIIVGVLYIIGTVAGVLSLVTAGPILSTPDYLAEISAHGTPLVVGALCILIMGLALAMVPVMMYPIAKTHSPTLALGYVVFRGALETLTVFFTVVSWLLLLPLSRVYMQAAPSDKSIYGAMGEVLQKVEMTGSVGTIVFIIGALMFYYLLYQSKLVPRWISGWGLISAIPYLAAAFLLLFGFTTNTSTADTVLRMPLALQEMVLAVWLIVKGFNPSAIVSGSAKVDVN